MSKWLALGTLSGIFIGLIFQFLFPDIFRLEVLFNTSLRQSTGIPLYPQYGSGSILAVSVLVPMLAGIAGGLVGLALYTIKRAKSKNTS